MARSTAPPILGALLVSAAIVGGACSFPDFTTTSWSSGAGGATSSAGGAPTSSASNGGGGSASSSGTGGGPETCDGGVICDGGACACDCDGDGDLSPACEPDPKKADCNDGVKAAHHGQMTCSSMPVVEGTTNYDWNCNGSSEYCFTAVVNCGPLSGCPDTEKWKKAPVPACGVSAATAKCVMMGLVCVQVDVGMRPQTCL